MSSSQTMDTQQKFKLILSQLPKIILLIISLSILTLLFTLNLQSNNIGSILRNATGTTNVQIAAGEATFIVISTLTGALIIFLLLLKNKFIILRVLIISSMFITLFITLDLNLTSLFSRITWIDDNLILLLNTLLSLILLYMIFINKNININIAGLTIFTSAMGSLLGTMFTEIQITLILIMLSLYDIFAVSKGPLKKIITKLNEIEFQEIAHKESIKNLQNEAKISDIQVRRMNKLSFQKGMFFTIGYVEFGVGDMLFYSAIISNALIIAFITYLTTLISIILGVIITLYLLTHKELVPGLPIPSLMGLTALWITKLILK